MNIATLKSKIYDSSLIGFTGGFYANIWLGKSNVTFSPDLFYTRKGAEDNAVINNEGKISKGMLKTDIDYIEIPFLFKYNFILSGPVKPAIYAGPYAAFKVGAKTVVETPTFKQKLGTSIKTSDFGLVFGGVSVSVGLMWEFAMNMGSWISSKKAKPQCLGLISELKILKLQIAYYLLWQG